MDQATLGLLSVARSVIEQLDLEVVLERVLHSARDLTGARYAALGVLDESRGELARFLTVGIDEETRRAIGPLPTGRGVLGELIRNPEALRIADVGSHRHSYGFPVGHPPMRSFLGVPIVVDDQPFGNLYLTEKHGASEFSEDDDQLVKLLAGFAGVAIGHARQFGSSETQRIDLQRTVAALDATMQITRALGGQTDLASILELVAKRGRALVSARTLVIELLRGDEMELAAGAGELPADLLGQRVQVENTVASAALRARQSQRLSDQLNRARFDQHGIGYLGMHAQDGLIVPLVFRDRAYGVLVAVDHLGEGEFTAEHQALLEAFATSAATAVATAQSVADERQRQRVAAAESERGRWARELHDETLQALGNLRLILSGAKRSGSADTMAAVIGQAIEQLEVDITTLRGLIVELRPAALDQLGVEPAVLALVDRFRNSGLDVDAQVDLAYEHGGERFVLELETGVYRIIQEALTNAAKHAGASHVVVELLEHDGSVSVKVSDDGPGFDAEVSAGGFGLPGMRERAELLGGDLTIKSAPGQGTTISASFPVSRRSGQRRDPQSSSTWSKTG
jgi:signal transduction histidine kinase